MENLKSFLDTFYVGSCLLLSDNYRCMCCHHRSTPHQSVRVRSTMTTFIRVKIQKLSLVIKISTCFSCVAREKVRNFSLYMSYTLQCNSYNDIFKSMLGSPTLSLGSLHHLPTGVRNFQFNVSLNQYCVAIRNCTKNPCRVSGWVVRFITSFSQQIKFLIQTYNPGCKDQISASDIQPQFSIFWKNQITV